MENGWTNTVLIDALKEKSVPWGDAKDRVSSDISRRISGPGNDVIGFHNAFDAGIFHPRCLR